MLKILAHCAMEFKENSACLERLEEACDRQGGLSELAAQAQSLVQAFSLTLPDHQRRQLFRHVCDMKLTYTSPVASTKDERYEYVPRETILNLITSGAQDKCTLCLTEPTEVAACTFRRAVNELRMDAVPDDLLGCTVRLLASPK